MANGLKNEWKKTGVALGHAFRDPAKTVVKSAGVAVDKAKEWANEDKKLKAEAEAKEEAKEQAKTKETDEAKTEEKAD